MNSKNIIPKATKLMLPLSFSQLFYHHFEVRIAASDDTLWDAWPGAFVRNNLLAAAACINVSPESTLLDCIDHFPLDVNHPRFKAFNEGFPKGYIIAMPDDNAAEMSVNKGMIIRFSVYLIGRMAEYFPHFIQAIRLMCEKGMGHKLVPFYLVDVIEISHKGQQQVLSIADHNLSDSLSYPCYFSDYMPEEAKQRKSALEITFLTPAILYRPTKIKNSSISFQAKSNGFPSFYQLVRSSVNRLSTLTLLYSSPDNTDLDAYSENALESWIDTATKPILIAADIHTITLKNTPKKESKATTPMPIIGYIGKQIYEGNFNRFLPLLTFMEALGVGNETVFGMGRFQVKER